jgi:hypothetical protein
MISLADILREIKPHVLRWVGEGSGGPGPYAQLLTPCHHLTIPGQLPTARPRNFSKQMAVAH